MSGNERRVGLVRSVDAQGVLFQDSDHGLVTVPSNVRRVNVRAVWKDLDQGRTRADHATLAQLV